jgi:hypothetical protein
MKTFTVIMCAGRCGSSALISYLNTKPNFHFYGENNGAIYSTIHTIKLLTKIHYYNHLSSKTRNKNNNRHNYIGSEWYNPPQKISSLQKSLENSLINFFDTNCKYVGFKEIRWSQDLSCLNILDNIFNKVKYVFLVRDINQQVHSMKKLNWTGDHLNRTININNNIQNFLNKKPKNQYIIKNISTDKNFQEEVYDFIVGQN